MRLLLLLAFTLFLHVAVAQSIKGRVTDAITESPLPFVAVVITNTNQGVYTDIDGYFELPALQEGTQVTFSFVGYESLQKGWEGAQPWAVKLAPKPFQLAEVVVLAGENPAERIIRKAIENKDQNHPEKGNSFTYDSYNKLVFTMLLDSSIASDPVKYNSLDSSSQEVVDFTKEQHLFLIESVSKRKFLPPGKSEETIVASRVSGLSNPQFSLLATQLQSFSFYGESVNIFDLSFLSPLSDQAIKKYLFILEDTTYAGSDTVFTISFRPRKGKNFTGMQGQLFIHTQGYAIQNVIAEPFESSTGFHVKIQQHYEFIQSKKWFPIQLNSLITMPFASLENFDLVGIGKSYIKNIVLDPGLRARDFTPVTIQMQAGAQNAPDSLWNQYRTIEPDPKDAKTYQVLDSVGKAENFDRFAQAMLILSTGKIPWGPVSFDIDRFMRFNNFEGFRGGLGMHTNERMSRYFEVGGYWAYGFRDKRSKYGGDLLVHLKKKRNMWVKFLYEQDVMETGGNQLDHSYFTSGLNTAIYPLFISRMDRREKWQAEWNGRMIGNLTGRFFTNAQRITPYRESFFLEEQSSDETRVVRSFDVNEIGAVLRWAPGEKLARVGQREVRLGGRWPVVLGRVVRSGDFWSANTFEYTRVDVQVEKTFKMTTLGALTVMAVGGMVDNVLPISLLYNARGTNANYSIASPFAFETMRTNEFMHDRFVAVHIRHNFKTLLLKTKNFSPQFQLVHNMLWGNLEKPALQSIAVDDAEKGFLESGLQIDGLIKSQFSALGIGVFYRYGAYHLPKTMDNFAFKLTSTLAF
jgi:hypothetical protein